MYGGEPLGKALLQPPLLQPPLLKGVKLAERGVGVQQGLLLRPAQETALECSLDDLSQLPCAVEVALVDFNRVDHGSYFLAVLSDLAQRADRFVVGFVAEQDL